MRSGTCPFISTFTEKRILLIKKSTSQSLIREILWRKNKQDTAVHIRRQLFFQQRNIKNALVSFFISYSQCSKVFREAVTSRFLYTHWKKHTDTKLVAKKMMKNARKIGRVARVSKGSIFPRSQDQVHKKTLINVKFVEKHQNWNRKTVQR